MNHSSFIRRLKDSRPASQFPWVLSALRQDLHVWESLQEPGFTSRVFAEDVVELLEGEVDDLARAVETLREENQFLQRLLEDSSARNALPPRSSP